MKPSTDELCELEESVRCVGNVGVEKDGDFVSCNFARV